MLSTFWSKNFVEPFVVKTHKRITTEHTITSGRSCNDCCFEARCPENIVLKTPWDVKALSYWLCHYVCDYLLACFNTWNQIDPGFPNILDTFNVLFL